MTKRLTIVTVLCMSLAIVVAAGPARATLVDMVGHWAGGIVSALESKGIINGDELGRFNPDAPLTRAQMAKLVVAGLRREADAKLLAGSPSRFSDVPSWHWAKGYIESLAESGVTDGYPDGRFGPSDLVTRAQMAQFLVRAAGLADEARLRRLEVTTYRDDRALPDWARGAVVVARDYGLMAGFEDGTFQPDQPVTRAQGSVALARLMEYRGTLYHLTGTLLKLDPVSRTGVVRDALGAERSFVMAPGAQYYRGGAPATIMQVQPLDQVWVTLNDAGEGQFLEARSSDLAGSRPTVLGSSLTLTLPGGTVRTVPVQPGALIYVTGRPATLDQVASATDVYVALDQVTGAARVIDAMRATLQGVITSVDPGHRVVEVNTEGQVVAYQLDLNALLLQDGRTCQVADLVAGSRVRFAAGDSGLITYLWAER